MPQISKEQIEQLITVICTPEHQLEGEDRASIAMLQGLLGQPDGEPVARLMTCKKPLLVSVETIARTYEEFPTRQAVSENFWAEGRPLYTHPAPFTPITADKLPQRLLEQPEQILKDALVDIICQHTVLTYHCTRTWSAWGFGTMTQDDFEEVNESDTPDELADAILAKIATHPAPFTPITAEDVTFEMVDAYVSASSPFMSYQKIIAFAVNAYMGAKK